MNSPLCYQTEFIDQDVSVRCDTGNTGGHITAENKNNDTIQLYVSKLVSETLDKVFECQDYQWRGGNIFAFTNE